ncbi:MAG: baseplate J/gp47 family protein [bacterium]|jgi:uncharacterized phage protein gp47/JayE
MRPIPTIQQLNANISGDFKNKLNLTNDALKKVLYATSLVLSGQFHLAFLYLRDIQDNIFPDTANTEDVGGTLERQGRIYLNRDRFPDSVGSFKVSVTGVAASVLRKNLTFKSNEGTLNPGQVYILDAEYICTGTDDEITIRSLGAGSTFNLAVGNNLTITEPVIGVDKTVSVTEVVTQPRAGETVELYRQAILNAIQLEPQGGSRADYRQWATDAQGVRLIYPYVADVTTGIVSIYVEAVPIDSTDGLGTPTSAILNDVEEVLNFDPDVTKPDYERGRKPAQAFLNVLPITLVPVDITIIGLNVETTAIQNTIQSSIEELLYRVRPFIAGADLLRNKNDILYYGKMQSAVTESLTNGNFYNNLELFVDGNAVVSYEFNLGNVPYLRNLNFS